MKVQDAHARGAALPPEGPSGWMNRSTVGIAAASLFSDVSHELATAVLPAVILSIGAGPAALGIIEGASDGISALSKIWGGVMTDRVRRRKPLASAGYLVTAVGVAAIGLCTRAWQVLLCRMAAWIGRGSRSAARDFLMSESAPPAVLGKAFGLERAGDALGAVLGPLLAIGLLARGFEARHIMIWSLVPGLLAFLSIALIVVERPGRHPHAPATGFTARIAGTGPSFRRYLVGILTFGAGDFSRTLLILYATQNVTGSLFSLAGATLAIALYVLHNAVSAVASLPIGALADRIDRRTVIAVGYVFAAATTAAFAILPPTAVLLMILFVASGLYIACEEVVEKAYAVEILPADSKGTGLGLLAATNGIGDMVSSAVVGVLWAAFPGTPAVGFLAAASLQLAGAIFIATARR